MAQYRSEIESSIESIEFIASGNVSSSVRRERAPKPSSSDSILENQSEEEEETEESPLEEVPSAFEEDVFDSSSTAKKRSRPVITSAKKDHKKKINFSHEELIKNPEAARSAKGRQAKGPTKVATPKAKPTDGGKGCPAWVTTRAQAGHDSSKGKCVLAEGNGPNSKKAKLGRDLPTNIYHKRGTLLSSTMGMPRDEATGYTTPTVQKATPPPPRLKETVDLTKGPDKE
ncbi:hypothetical protein NE237_004114 [Protea cynaroides]|uniref:Uncharacterized protein n=1 Tax=Protea cynaroides TaxID=273540 RepID=A0A9Q0KIC3_9MAGN|nr:hypothetical protein NE237_004114 [Protea cynaroides]